MNQPPIPEFICPSCKEYDWCWNKDMNRWECRVCSVYGRPEPDPPEFDGVSNGSEWVDISLREYDVAYQELEDAKAAPKNGEAESILWLARVKKADRKLALANAKADIASDILEIQKINTRGDIYLDLPDIDLKLRIQW